jgi:alginate O-acetyltransferase complex protein AlgI
LLPGKYRNSYIFVASLFFYSIDAGLFTAILLLSVFTNYYIALLLQKVAIIYKRLLLGFGIALNLAPLMYYKYWEFFLKSTNDLLSVADKNLHVEVPEIVLLSGVSFFTFHAISYLIDVYCGKVRASDSLMNFGMYMTNFPQLIAGPIVRYSEIEKQISNRPNKEDQITSGINTFILGLFKKVVFADTAGSIADQAFSIPHSELTITFAWLGAICYSLQIYFDFAGYSSMAIGLGKIMGFAFPENFNQPYRAKNITEFWHRWHMTLSRWFRDYLYIPLGGNRSGKSKTLFNLFMVFLLCGLWHGAAYTFIAWGIYHGILLVIEKELLIKFGLQSKGIFGQILTLILIIIGWVIFRSNDLYSAWQYLITMFDFRTLVKFKNSLDLIKGSLDSDNVVYLTLAIICALIPIERIKKYSPPNNVYTYILKGMLGILGFIFCVLLISENGFNPFIYFRF